EERGGLLPQQAGEGAHHPCGAGTALRPRPRAGTCGADQRAARAGAPRIPPGGGAELIGALLVDKPAGVTSHDVVARLRRGVGTTGAGITGTVAPVATGR